MKHRHIFYFSLFLFSSFSILFHTNIPVIWPDEVLFFNPSLELGNTGIMRTSVLDGLIPGMDTHTLWMPPFYMILLSFILKVFPPELYIARLFSSFISLGSIYLVYKLCLRFQFSARRIIWVLLLLATDFLFLKFSHTARMESLCLFFGLAAFYFLIQKKSENDFSFQSLSEISSSGIFLSGICLSFSFLSHPFGIVNSIAVLYLLYQHESFTFRNILLYCCAGLIPILFWGLYVFPNWDLFVVQFGAQLSRKNELLGKFTWVDKIKIIFSVYKFPIFKLILFVCTIAFVLFNLIKFNFRSKESLEIKLKLKEIKISAESFFLVWITAIFGFLLVSSESWYVFHMVVPFTFLLSALAENGKKVFKYFLSLSFIYNVIVIVWVPFSLYFLYKSHDKTNEFFYLIEKEIERKNNIYLQVFPDPYFYLKKKFPEKKMREFIPGELSAIQKTNADGSKKQSLLSRLGITKENYKINANFYRETIHKQDVFVFYNESLMNDYIREYLLKNHSEFERKSILVETPKGSDLKLEASIYVRK